MNAMGTRRLAVLVGGLAIAAATLVGCQQTPAELPKESAPTTSWGPSYQPGVIAPAAPTALPGNVITGG
jgi:hypothetical protein